MRIFSLYNPIIYILWRECALKKSLQRQDFESLLFTFFVLHRLVSQIWLYPFRRTHSGKNQIWREHTLFFSNFSFLTCFSIPIQINSKKSPLRIIKLYPEKKLPLMARASSFDNFFFFIFFRFFSFIKISVIFVLSIFCEFFQRTT